MLIVDVNPAGVYAKGHLPGAVWSSLQDVEKKLPADRSVRIVSSCLGVT